MNPDFRRRLLSGQRLFGTLLALPSADVAEIVAGVGFDWLFVDTEHGAFGPSDLLPVLRAVGATPCLVRTPPGDDAAIGRALDAGATGVIVPQVHDAAQAAHVVRLARYAPAGHRGRGVTRSTAFGRYGPPAGGDAEDPTVVVVQAESASAVADIEAMVRVPGVDAVLIGPNDLAASLGQPGRLDHPSVHEAIGRVIDTCRSAGRVSGIFGVDMEAVRPWVLRGAGLAVVGVDALLLAAAATALHRSLDGLRENA